MLSSLLAWQLFVGCFSAAEIAVFALGSVLVCTYLATLWQTRRTLLRHAR